MAASSQDLLMEVGIATATTLDANYTINDTSITVASTSGWPTATGVAFAIDVVDSAGVQVPGTYNEYVGVVSSATSITSVDHVNGTDRNYSAGATTRVYIPVSAERENRIVEWGTVQHKQDGTHADTITTDTINENTAANGVTIDGLNIKDSKLVTANSVVTTNITDDAVTVNKINLGEQGAAVATSQTTTSTSYADLGTVGPSVTVTIGSSGVALLTMFTQAALTNSLEYILVSYEASGANTIAASDNRSAAFRTASTNQESPLSYVVLLTGLTPGSTTFTMKYRVSAGTGTYQRRHMSVIPL